MKKANKQEMELKAGFAADVPASVSGLFELLDKLDEEIAAAGGTFISPRIRECRQGAFRCVKAVKKYFVETLK